METKAREESFSTTEIMEVMGKHPRTSHEYTQQFLSREDLPVQANQSVPELSGASGILFMSIKSSLALTGSGPLQGFLHARGDFFNLIRKSRDVRRRRLYSSQAEE